MRTFLLALAFLLPLRPAFAGDVEDAAVKKGLDALVRQQQKDGHWGDKFPVAVTSIGGLAILAGDENALKNESLWKAFAWLRSRQKDGEWAVEGHTWLHSQGFATLFTAELYGRILQSKEKPAQVSEADLKTLLTQAVDLVERAQSQTGGWYYHKAAESHEHEGSTTVCAVQALRAAQNFGIPVKKHVLDRGFAYLKETQNPDGGFEYQKGSGTSMVAGTSGALATLVLMQKLDEKVLIDSMAFLKKTGFDGLAADRFPYYAFFYTSMGMQVICEEYGKHMPDAAEWTGILTAGLLKWQEEDGSFKNRSWMLDQEPSHAYSTGMGTLTLASTKGRLSLFHRDAPELAK